MGGGRVVGDGSFFERAGVENGGQDIYLKARAIGVTIMAQIGKYSYLVAGNIT